MDLRDNNIFLGRHKEEVLQFIDITDPRMADLIPQQYVNILQVIDYLIRSEFQFENYRGDNPFFLVCVQNAEDEEIVGPRIFSEGETLFLAITDPKNHKNPLYSVTKSSQSALFTLYNFYEEFVQYSSDLLDIERVGDFFNMDAKFVALHIMDWRLLAVMAARFAAAKGYSVDMFGIEGPKGNLPHSLKDAFDFLNDRALEMAEEPLEIPVPYAQTIEPIAGPDFNKH